MTIRSKQWYTKTSRLENSFAKSSIGRQSFDLVWTTRSSAERPVESKFQISWLEFDSQLHVRMPVRRPLRRQPVPQGRELPRARGRNVRPHADKMRSVEQIRNRARVNQTGTLAEPELLARCQVMQAHPLPLDHVHPRVSKMARLRRAERRR